MQILLQISIKAIRQTEKTFFPLREQSMALLFQTEPTVFSPHEANSNFMYFTVQFFPRSST